MGRLQRLIAATVLVTLCGALVGCSSSVNSFDPMDWLDWIDTKKKLQGERKQGARQDVGLAEAAGGQPYEVPALAAREAEHRHA